MPLNQKIAVTITPESNVSCQGCRLFWAERCRCHAGFVLEHANPLDVWAHRPIERPQACRDAAATMELAVQHLNTWNQLP